MTKTVIQLTPDKHDEALDLLDRCFEASRVWFETHQKADPNWDISQQFVIEDDQELIGHIWIANREMRYGSGLIPIGGIADVAVRSDHRNRGNAGNLLDAAIDYMDTSQQHLSLLHLRECVDH